MPAYAKGGGMMVGMTQEKIAVSLPPRLLKAVKAAVSAGRAPSVSAYVAGALEERTMLDDLSSMLDELLTSTGGPLTAAERRRADQVLRGSRRRRK